jgi:chemotaxis-related protein WspD
MPLSMDDCWNRIGVRGDGSCAELAACAHCRNCPIYTAAATRLFDRPLGDAWLDAATAEVANPAAYGAAADKASAIIFRVAEEWFALSPLAFDEIAEPRTIRSLPHRRGGALLGVANVRGELVLCVSLGRVLGLPDAAEPAHGGRLIVLTHPEGRVAFPVDEVRSIHLYAPEELKPPPATVAGAAAAFAEGLVPWQGRMVGRLDSARLAEALNRSVA